MCFLFNTQVVKSIKELVLLSLADYKGLAGKNIQSLGWNFVMVKVGTEKTLNPSAWQWSCHYLVCRGWYSNSQPSICGANALTDCATAAAIVFLYKNQTFKTSKHI